ncbi:MAG: 3-hydroxyacyl-CoA dehydrogenase [Halieaceae bacterium]|jgi:3-hydroxyacyl-CoA dehydrogenase|nr:3-hydroxyacyl-CoA dehydrogenase [Halieaceae bacterium]
MNIPGLDPDATPDSRSSAAGARVAVVGGGSIGSAFALVFASAGCRVALYDPEAASLEGALAYIERSLNALSEAGLMEVPVASAMANIRCCRELEAAVDGASWVHECAPERVEVKSAIFAALDRAAPRDAILASATSAIPASQFASELDGRDRCLVAHPGNPPFLLRVIELVAAPFTSSETIERASAFARAVDLDPIIVRREVEGFLFNRLQGALLREAYCLVRDGVASVDDIDRLVRKGLGLRWSVIGPFETADLNTRGGIEAHAQKLGPAYARMGAERGQNDPWTKDLVAQVVAERRALLPLEHWAERVAWRDRELMRRLSAAADRGPVTGTDDRQE